MASVGGSDGMLPLARVIERAYAGEPEGTFAYAGDDESFRFAVLLRPSVPMGQLVAAPAVVALGVLDALEALGVPRDEVGIAWPHDVVRVEGNDSLASISTKAGYDDGMFLVAGIDFDASGGDALAQALCDAVTARAHAWAEASHTSQAKAGPWAPFLPEYFDRVVLMGQPVDVCYPNGRVYARGYLVGIDIWGRATVRTKRAGDLEFAPEQYVIRPQT